MKLSSFSPRVFAVLIAVLAVLAAFVHVGIVRIAFEKLGLTPGAAFLALFASLFGSVINIPVFTIRSSGPVVEQVEPIRSGLLNWPRQQFAGKTLVAVNVGGCIIPVLFSGYLLISSGLPLFKVVLEVVLVAAISRALSRPIKGLGIAMPVFVAPVSAAMLALALDVDHSAALAYVGGAMGVLIGADISRIGDIRQLGSAFASIGGAGTFDGIFLSGIVAVLLA